MSSPSAGGPKKRNALSRKHQSSLRAERSDAWIESVLNPTLAGHSAKLRAADQAAPPSARPCPAAVAFLGHLDLALEHRSDEVTGYTTGRDQKGPFQTDPDCDKHKQCANESAPLLAVEVTHVKICSLLWVSVEVRARRPLSGPGPAPPTLLLRLRPTRCALLGLPDPPGRGRGRPAPVCAGRPNCAKRSDRAGRQKRPRSRSDSRWLPWPLLPWPPPRLTAELPGASGGSRYPARPRLPRPGPRNLYCGSSPRARARRR